MDVDAPSHCPDCGAQLHKTVLPGLSPPDPTPVHAGCPGEILHAECGACGFHAQEWRIHFNPPVESPMPPPRWGPHLDLSPVLPSGWRRLVAVAERRIMFAKVEARVQEEERRQGKATHWTGHNRPAPHAPKKPGRRRRRG